LTEKQEELQREYQKIIEKNEDLLFENQKLKNLALDTELGLNEAEKINNINDDLLVQLEDLKRKVSKPPSIVKKFRPRKRKRPGIWNEDI
jgi:hypothetical protein